jgi:hypothetical protein
MYLKIAVHSIFEEIKNNLDFTYLNLPGQDNTDTEKYYIYDPALNFDERLHKRLAYLEYEDREEPFICAMWNMSTVNAITEQSRKFKGYLTDEESGIATGYLAKFLRTQLNLCFVSNDPDLLVDFEEQFATVYDRSFTLKPIYEIPLNYQSLGNITGVDITLKTFIVTGNQNFISVGDNISVFNSNLNDGNYTVSNVAFTTTDTIVTVTENIPSNSISGVIVKKGGTAFVQSSIYYSGIEFSQIDKLDTTSRGELTFLTVSMSVDYPVLSLIPNDSGSNPFGKIIKFIHFRTKTINEPQKAVTSDMILPYDETIIQ